MNRETKDDLIGAFSTAMTCELLVVVAIIVGMAVGVNVGAITNAIANQFGG